MLEQCQADQLVLLVQPAFWPELRIQLIGGSGYYAYNQVYLQHLLYCSAMRSVRMLIDSHGAHAEL